MDLKLRIEVDMLSKSVELTRYDTCCTIDNSVPFKAVLKASKHHPTKGWIFESYEEFEGEKREVFNKAYRKAIQILSVANRTEECFVVEHLMENSPDW